MWNAPSRPATSALWRHAKESQRLVAKADRMLESGSPSTTKAIWHSARCCRTCLRPSRTTSIPACPPSPTWRRLLLSMGAAAAASWTARDELFARLRASPRPGGGGVRHDWVMPLTPLVDGSGRVELPSRPCTASPASRRRNCRRRSAARSKPAPP